MNYILISIVDDDDDDDEQLDLVALKIVTQALVKNDVLHYIYEEYEVCTHSYTNLLYHQCLIFLHPSLTMYIFYISYTVLKLIAKL